ncbi:MAG: ATP phosphoribosyltransferase regulatory subunit [Dichotomicrobium sp.]
MVAESARAFDALERQADQLVGIFQAADYERVAPAIIQPASIFLDRVGEGIRARTYVFTDADGTELCLRPDLTIPVARLYMERHPGADIPARYCYNGPAFRHQPANDTLRPREFRQAGIEYFGASDKEKAEVEVLSLIHDALQRAGLQAFTLHIGDLGLFRALLDALDLPERWRTRLINSFWRPQAFQATLGQLCEGGAKARRGEDDLARRLDPDDPEAGESMVGDYLAEKDIAYIGARTLSEITQRLLERAADLKEAPLAPEHARLIESYLAVSGPPRAACARIEDLLSGSGLRMKGALDSYKRRCDLMQRAGIDLGKAVFSADFGRNFEYYSGFVFQMEVPGVGTAGHIAGGGRYDGLLAEIGATRDVPAVGSAIHTERLLAAVRGLPA